MLFISKGGLPTSCKPLSAEKDGPATGIAMRPQKVEYRTAVSGATPDAPGTNLKTPSRDHRIAPRLSLGTVGVPAKQSKAEAMTDPDVPRTPTRTPTGVSARTLRQHTESRSTGLPNTRRPPPARENARTGPLKRRRF